MTRLVTLGELDRTWSGRWNLGQAMTLPVAKITVHHTVTADTGNPIADGAAVHDIDQGRFGKISYSWLVHESSGSWIEGETVHRGAHTINNANQSLNGVSFGVGVIGNFHPAAPIPPPRPASDALVALIAAGIREFIVGPGLVSPGFVIDGHRDVYATACCGDNLYDRLPIIRTLVSSPPPIPQPSPEDTMNFHYAQHAGDPKVYLVNLAASPRHVTLFRDAEFWAIHEGHTVVNSGSVDLGADGNGDIRKGEVLDDKGAALFGIV